MGEAEFVVTRLPTRLRSCASSRITGSAEGDRVRVPSQEPFPLPCQIFSFDRDGFDYPFFDLAAGEKLCYQVSDDHSVQTNGHASFSHAPKSVIQIYLGKLNLIVT